MKTDNLKKKLETDATSKSKVKVSNVQFTGEKNDQTQNISEEVKSFWESTVNSLQTRKFKSLDEIKEALIFEVINKLPKAHDQNELKEFLNGLIDSDLGLQTKLEQLLLK